MNDVIESLKVEFQENHKKRLAEAELQGKLIGNEDLPEVDESHQHPYEDTLLKKYEGDLNKLEQKCNRHIEEPYSNYVQINKELQVIVADEEKYIDKLVKNINDDLKLQLAKENEKSSATLNNINDRDQLVQYEFNSAEENLVKMQLKLDRKYLNISFKSTPWYITIMVILAIAETPLNFTIFSQFRESNLSTILMACTLIIGIPLGAHFCGLYLKRRNDRIIHIYISLVIFILIASLSYYVGLQRADFMQKFPAIDNSITLPTFVALSLFLFLIGTFLSYSHYDDSSEFQSAWGKFNKAQTIYNDKMPKIKEERRNENERISTITKKLKEDSNQKIKESKAVRIRYEEKLAMIKSKYDSNIKTLEAEAKNLISFCSESISTFRRYNLSARQNHKMPISFKTDPKTPINPFSKFIELDPNDII